MNSRQCIKVLTAGHFGLLGGSYSPYALPYIKIVKCKLHVPAIVSPTGKQAVSGRIHLSHYPINCPHRWHLKAVSSLE